MRNILLTLLLFLGAVSVILYGDWWSNLSRKRQSLWVHEDYSYLGPLDTIYTNRSLFRETQRYQCYPDDAVILEDNLVTEVSGVIPPKLEHEAFAEETHNALPPPPILPIVFSDDFEHRRNAKTLLFILLALLSRLPPSKENPDYVREELHNMWREPEILKFRIQCLVDFIHQISKKR
jgi:hypothetical protein